MALVPIATQGNFLHIYDFIVDADHIDDFVKPVSYTHLTLPMSDLV